METNTVQTLIDYAKDLTGLTNASNAKIIRALNFTVDDYSRLQLFSSGKWKRDSMNHSDLSRVTATLPTTGKVSLETEMITIEYVDILIDGKYQRLKPVDQRDSDTPLDTLYGSAGVPKAYDWDMRHLYSYPTPDTSYTIRMSYGRAHPRFSANNLTQEIGIIPIDEEYLALGAAARMTIGSNDPSHVSIRQMHEQLRADIKDSLSKADQDTPRRMKGKVPSVFMRKSR